MNLRLEKKRDSMPGKSAGGPNTQSEMHAHVALGLVKTEETPTGIRYIGVNSGDVVGSGVIQKSFIEF